MRHPALLVVGLLALGPTSAALAQGAGTFTPVQNGYRWSRGAVTIDVLAHGKTWSAAEADCVRQSLDRLPDSLLTKATRYIHTFYRDAGKSPNITATTHVPGGYTSFFDLLFGATPNVNVVYDTVTHELGHGAQYAVLGDGPLLGKLRAVLLGTPNWTPISWSALHGYRSWNGFVSDYARTNDREDFAETAEYYWLAPDELLRTSPAKFAYMRDVVYDQAVSPPTSRWPALRAIAPVTPTITRLGDVRDDPLSLVQIHGEHFMGPRDGGFNRVQYRGTKALHLTVSRTTIWSWVPTISTGQAAVTVTTNDGTSPPAAFEVKKPWWKFW
jgi:hypothetical protein